MPAYYPPWLRAKNIYWFNERKRFPVGKRKNITRTNNSGLDYADDIALRTNTPAQAETLLHSIERAAGGIGLHVNADKTE